MTDEASSSHLLTRIYTVKTFLEIIIFQHSNNGRYKLIFLNYHLFILIYTIFKEGAPLALMVSLLCGPL